jgi:hypothetical protein
LPLSYLLRNDQLTVICGLAHLGGDASYDTERTESYVAQIESAGKKAAQITRQLLVLDPRQLSEDETDPERLNRRSDVG